MCFVYHVFRTYIIVKHAKIIKNKALQKYKIIKNYMDKKYFKIHQFIACKIKHKSLISIGARKEIMCIRVTCALVGLIQEHYIQYLSVLQALQIDLIYCNLIHMKHLRFLFHILYNVADADNIIRTSNSLISNMH